MFQNKKAQGMVIDLILLILISSLFFILMSSQLPSQAPEAGVIRSKSTQIQRLLINVMNTESKNTTYPNSTVAELIGEQYCGKNTLNDINATIQNSMNNINKEDFYFIFLSCVEGDCSKSSSFGVCSPDIESKFGTCCVKTDKVTVAKLRLNLPETCSKEYTDIEMGIWSKNIEVEKC